MNLKIYDPSEKEVAQLLTPMIHDTSYLLKIFGIIYLGDGANQENFPIPDHKKAKKRKSKAAKHEDKNILIAIKKIEEVQKGTFLEKIARHFYNEIETTKGTFEPRNGKYYWVPESHE